MSLERSLRTLEVSNNVELLWDFAMELHCGRVFVENGAPGVAATVERDHAVEGLGEVEEVGLDEVGVVGEGGGSSRAPTAQGQRIWRPGLEKKIRGKKERMQRKSKGNRKEG